MTAVSNLTARNQVSNITRDLTQRMEGASTVLPETQTHQEIISSEDDFCQMERLDMLKVIENNGPRLEEVDEKEEECWNKLL